MGIPIGTTYSATLSNSVMKGVNCEKCKCEFVYLLEREVVGQSTSWLFLDNKGAKNAAVSEAERQLDHVLKTDCDPVPCPSCGWYQESMCVVLKQQHRFWMLIVGGCICAVGFMGLLSFVSNALGPYQWGTAVYVSAAVAVSGGLVGGAIILTRRALAKRYNPNDDPLEIRQKIARNRAKTRAEFEQMIIDQEQAVAERKPDPRWGFLEEGEQNNPTI